MQPGSIEQELSAIPDVGDKHRRWLELVQIATRESPTNLTESQDPNVASFLWQYPLTLTTLDPQTQRQWQRDASIRFNLHRSFQSDLNSATAVQKRKLACKTRILKAWGIEVENILTEHLTVGAGGLGRSTLELLATIAEESPFDEAESVLRDVVIERVATVPHVGRSRKMKLTRQDVMKARHRLREREQEPGNTEPITNDMANVTGRQKRKRAGSSSSTRAQSKHGEQAQRVTASPADLPTPGASVDQESSRSTEEREMASKSPEVGRNRPKSLPDVSSNFGDDELPREPEQSCLDSMDPSPTPKSRGGTLEYSLLCGDRLQLISENTINIDNTMPDATTELDDTRGISHSPNLSGLPPDISSMPLGEANQAVREFAQTQFSHFFESLKAIQQLQASNIARANDEIMRIESLIKVKDREAADFDANVQAACRARDVAEASEQSAHADVIKHRSLRAICQENDFSDAIRLALSQAEVELEKLDQVLESTAQAAEEAHEEVETCEDTLQQCQLVLKSLRQELLAAEKVRNRCQNTNSVLQGSSDEILSLSLGPRFPRDDVV